MSPYLYEYRRSLESGPVPQKPIPCAECDGEGEIIMHGRRIAGYNSAGAPYPTEYVDRCERCKGSGEEPCVHTCDRAAVVESDDGPSCASCALEGS